MMEGVVQMMKADNEQSWADQQKVDGLMSTITILGIHRRNWKKEVWERSASVLTEI